MLSIASLASVALARVAIGANIMLAVLTALGLAPLLVALVAGTAPPGLVWNAIGATALAAASAVSAIALRRLSSRTAIRVAHGASADRAGRGK